MAPAVAATASSTRGSKLYSAGTSQMTRLARVNFNAFMGKVMKDEHSGSYLSQAPIHRAWAQEVEKHSKLILWSAVEHGKTTQMSIGRPLFLIGQNPNIRIAIVSQTQRQAGKIAGAIKGYIERSAEYHAVFPHVTPSHSNWAGTFFTVRRPIPSKEPTVQAIGVGGSLQGSRLDLLILDDVLDEDNTRTPENRERLYEWFMSSKISGRLEANGRFIMVGTAYHPEDLMHTLGKVPGFTAQRYPVLDPHTNLPRWPERWPMSRIEERKSQLTPIEFARQLLCTARSDEASRFKKEWIERALQKGNGRSLSMATAGHTEGWGLRAVPRGCRIYTGVDLAISQKDSADETVLFTIQVHPNGDREVLEILAGHWQADAIMREIVSAHQRWFSNIIVENNAAQDYIRQMIGSNTAVPIEGYTTTGSAKHHVDFGIESLASELHQGKWIIPNQNGRTNPEVSKWVNDMLYYQPTNHTGDRLMAMWFAREGVRLADKNTSAVWSHLNITAR